jgi:Malectin domain
LPHLILRWVPQRSHSLRILPLSQTYHDGPGRRLFHVSLEGKQVISNLDIFAIAGKNRAFDVVRTVTVTGNELTIGFSTLIDNAMISAFKVDRIA